MFNTGIIQPSNNPYAIPLCLQIRLKLVPYICGLPMNQCINDIRPLSSSTESNKSIQQIADEDIPKTAVTTPFGHFEFQ